MLKSQYWGAFWVAATMAVSASGFAQSGDPVCEQLFHDYLAKPLKIDSDTLAAATQLVVVRGRMSGYWRTVLQKLESGDRASERSCVRVLGGMLAAEADGRYPCPSAQANGPRQRAIMLVLSHNVVDTLVARAAKAERPLCEDYAIALVRGRVSEARPLFRTILASSEGAGFDDATRYYAALGLAQYGEAAGYRWLIGQLGEDSGARLFDRPYGALANDLRSGSLAALRELTGRDELSTPAQWRSWLAHNPPLPQGHVLLHPST